MGVKLGDIVTRKQLTFGELAHKTVAIDFSNCAYQFLSSIRQQDGTPLLDAKGRVTSYLMGIWTRFSNLLQQNIKLVVVFDGTMPELKHGTSSLRHERKELAKQLYEAAKREKDIEEMARYAKQVSYLTSEMVDESKKLLSAMGIPFVQAPAEADAQMSYLCKQGNVWATASSDYDSLLHGSPRMITNLTLSQRRRTSTGTVVKIFPELIELESVLKALHITLDQLIIVSILSGTDYNPGGIRGIGPKKALKLVHGTKDYDGLFKDLNAEFDWKEIMQLFKRMDVKKDCRLAWGQPDLGAIKKVLVDDHNFSENRVASTYNKLIKAGQQKEQRGLGGWI